MSDWRTSGTNAMQFVGGIKNWHRENPDGTLAALKELGNVIAQ